MNLQEIIYYSSPSSVQSLLVSLYGKKLYSKRYGNLSEILNEIMKAEALTDEQKKEYQSERLHELLKNVTKSVPYYTKLFSDYGFSPNQFTSIDCLKKLPILTKDTVRKSPEQFLAQTSEKKVTQRTSGTTGTPFQISMNLYTYQLKMALLVFHEMNHGVAFGEKRATFAGRLIKNFQDTKPPHFRLNRAENQAIFSTYHLCKETFPEYYEELEKLAPLELIGYPSALYNLACYYQESKTKPSWNPKCIITNSETLFDWQRHTIESTFRCKIYDYYGTAEHIVFAAQDKSGDYCINPNIGILEVNSEHKESSGKIIGTTLVNSIMPLIRFEIGDISEKKSAYKLSKITGRIDDQIITPDGRRIGRTGEIFGFFKNIREAQIIQNEANHCELVICKQNISEDVQEKEIIRKFKSKFGEQMNVTITYKNEIPKSANGKFKAVIGLKEFNKNG